MRVCGHGRGHDHLCVCDGDCAHGGARACERACAWPCACARASGRVCACECACARWCACDGECGACVYDQDVGVGVVPSTLSDAPGSDIMIQKKASFSHPALSAYFLLLREILRSCPRKEKSWMTSYFLQRTGQSLMICR